jgi:hypothetical protein
MKMQEVIANTDTDTTSRGTGTHAVGVATVPGTHSLIPACSTSMDVRVPGAGTHCTWYSKCAGDLVKF